MQSRATPNSRKKPHCKSCGSPMEGHRKSECPAYMEKGEDTNGLEPDTFLKTPTRPPHAPLKSSRSSSKSHPDASSSSSTTKQDIDSSLLFQESELGSVILVDPTSQESIDRKPTIVATPKTHKHELPPESLELKPNLALSTKREQSDDDSDDSDALNLSQGIPKPMPVASIYATSDVSPTDIQRACEQSKGKYHAGVFYTPIPVDTASEVTGKSASHSKSDKSKSTPKYKYKEWIIVGEDAELVKRVTTSSKPPGAFRRMGDDEVVEGPRMVTVPQLMFASFVGGFVVWYLLSVI
ncbi:hypothetical protein GYMLUDRAFT_39679 [Collybiopsis luxurians FD-317 M1]|nr:hypothetical protein GYMLUDRAFT_39679 [Collybiopsis luxurians FD-317 M1]